MNVRTFFQDIPVAGVRNGKSLKNHLVRVTLPTVEKIGRSELYGKRKCRVCYFICNTDTFLRKSAVKHSKLKVEHSIVALRGYFIY